MDKIDHKILLAVQKNADKRIHQLEKELKIPRSTIHSRLIKLKHKGIISQIKAVVCAKELGLNVCALIHIVVSSQKGVHSIANRLSKQKNVEEVYITAGIFDIVTKVRFKNNSELSSFIFDDKKGIKSWEGVSRTESMICLETVKENGVLE